MKLTWLGHACFLVEQDGYIILLDPYTGVEGYPPLMETAVRAASWESRAAIREKGFYTLAVKMRVFVDGEAASLAEKKLPVHKILCSHGHFDHNAVDQAETVPFEGQCPFSIRTVETFHDGQGGALRGTNTVHVLSAGGFTRADSSRRAAGCRADSCGRHFDRGRPGSQGSLRGSESEMRCSHALPPCSLWPAQCSGGGGFPGPVA